MPCSRCGRDVYPLHSIPTKVSKVTHKIKHVEWVCDRCLTPKEKFLIAIRGAQPKKKPAITLMEYYGLLERAKFKCPIGVEDLGSCDGHRCPSKPKPKCEYGRCDLDPKTCGGPSAGCYEDYYYECLEVQRVRAKLAKVWRGEIEVKNDDYV